MSNFVRLGVAAAAILAIAVLTFTLLPRDNVGTPSGPSLTVTPSPTPEPFPSGDVSTGGRYLVQLSHVPLDAAMTLDPGWTSGGWYISGPQGAVAFFSPENVNRDACRQEQTLPNPAIGPSVEDFLVAMDAQANSDMTPPVAVSIGGLTAQRIELRPSRGAPCGQVRWWKEFCCGEPEYRGADTGDDNPDTVWVVDVEGRRVAVVGYWDHSQPADGRAIEDIVRSIEFVHR